jgi:hypothetical protein
MFCPECKDEYREGFTRCGTCEVDLVADLSSLEPTAGAPSGRPESFRAVNLIEYCGFLALDDAREARDRLHVDGIPAEIVIRNLSAGVSAAPVEEEFWIRVPMDQVRRVTAILDDGERTDSPRSEAGGSAKCSDCGKTVQSEELFCPHCGARFE